MRGGGRGTLWPMKTAAMLLLLLSVPSLVSAKNYKAYFEKDDPASCRYE